MLSTDCPLCQSSYHKLYTKGENREYLYCKTCDLVYVPKDMLPTLKQEKTKYDQHQNSPEDKGYRSFLNKLFQPMKTLLMQDAKGLDFGSGPGPTLSKMFEEAGFEIDIYDIFYAKNEKVFQKKYDFITSTEVIEHIHDVNFEILRLWDMLKSGGFLGIMTAFRPSKEEFDKWYYKRDLTHVRFFTPKTFEYLSVMTGGKIVYIADGVVILKKS